ncbi:MAG: pyridoxal-phosphate dependent enzyme [Planctomycetota bacterium]
MQASYRDTPWQRFDAFDLEGAARRIEGRVVATPLLALPCSDPRLDVRGKLENRQATGSFKARGALNNILALSAEERARGVVAASSGNHGKALAWAARQAGVAATIVMPKDAYPNKIEACRAEGAEVVLSETRGGADELTARFVAEGRVLVHPYDRRGTIEGAGTVGLELARAWPEVEVVIACVGGGGLAAGTSLGLRRALGRRVRVFGSEPIGAPTMTLGLARGAPVTVTNITTGVQGLCPPYSGALNIDVCRATLDGMLTPDDAEILAAQRLLVRPDPARGWAGEVVEPAGAAAYAAALTAPLIRDLLEGRSAADPLRVAVTVSGGNPDPAQLAWARESEGSHAG